MILAIVIFACGIAFGVAAMLFLKALREPQELLIACDNAELDERAFAE